jgi:hypothetical protein
MLGYGIGERGNLMAEVMNRTVRRRAKTKTIECAGTGIYLVPMSLAEAYYRTHIAREDRWNDDPPVVVVRPAAEMFRATTAWADETFA